MPTRERRSQAVNPGAYRRPAIVVSVFLGLHLLPVFWRPDLMWGSDFLFYLPAPVQGIYLLLAGVLFVPAFRRRCRDSLVALPLRLWGPVHRVWFTRILVSVLGLAVFVALPSALHLLGDGYYLLTELVSDTWEKTYRAPLSFALIRAMHQAGQAIWQTPENTYRIYSYTSGFLYVLIAFPASSALGKNTLQKSVVFAFLLTTGYMQLFFGYVENYPLYMPALLLYVVLGLHTLENRLPLYAPALLLGVLFTLHLAFASLAPSLLVLALRAYRRRAGIFSNIRNGVTCIASLCCFPLSAVVFLHLSGVGFEAFLGKMGGRSFLPIFEEPGFLVQYRMFSLAHILDYMNLQLLSAPAACMALMLLRKKDFGRQPFLALCTVVPLFFTFVASPGIGAVRDWDIFSLPALPLTVLTASLIVNRIPNRSQLFHVAFLLCGAAALHTGLWVCVNASASAAEARIILLADRLTGSASVNTWVAVGSVRRQEKRYPEAIYAYKKARDADPSNPNRWILVGTVYRESGQSANAIEYFKKAHELLPNQAMPLMNLGAAYSDIRQFDKAIYYTQKAIALDPDLAAAHINLSTIYRKTGKFDRAVQHLEKAAALRRNDAVIHEHLAEMYRDMGENEKAIPHLEKANLLRPNHTRTLVNLALANSDAGKNARAIELLKEAAELEPGLAAVHLNLGVIYIRIDRHATGIQHLKRALELQPDNPLALQNIGFANFDLEEHERAIPFLQEAIQLDPDAADAHLLLGMTYRSLKRPDEARIHLEKTLELKPDHPQAAQIRQWLRQIRE